MKMIVIPKLSGINRHITNNYSLLVLFAAGAGVVVADVVVAGVVEVLALGAVRESVL